MAAYQAAKCPNCGASITEVDKKSGVCGYCHTSYIKNEQPLPPPPPPPPPPRPKNIPKRPQINWFFGIVLLMFWVVPGVVYIGYNIYEQYRWDQKYGKE